MEKMDSCYMLLASNGSTELYNNTLTHFRNKLPEIPNFSLNTWSVALQAAAIDLNLSDFPHTLQELQSPILYKQTGFTNRQNLPFNILQFDTQHYSSTTAFQQEFVRQLNVDKSDILQRLFFDMKITKGKIVIHLNLGTDFWIDLEVCKWLTFATDDISSDNIVVINGRHYQKFTNRIEAVKEQFATPRPEYIKLHLEDMKSHLSNSGFEKVLAYIPYAHSEKGSHALYHEVLRKEYFTFDHTNVSNLSVKLTDEKNRTLTLLSGQPTIVKLKLQKMSYTSFMLRIKSTAQSDIYNDNTNTDFHTILPYPISLNGGWKVALTSIQFPHQFDLSSVIPKNALWIDIDLKSSKRKRRDNHNNNNDIYDTYVKLKHIRQWKPKKSAIRKRATAAAASTEPEATTTTTTTAVESLNITTDVWDRVMIPEDAVNTTNIGLRKTINRTLRKHFKKRVVEIVAGKTVKFRAYETLKFRISPYLSYILGASSSFDNLPISTALGGKQLGVFDLPIDISRLSPHSFLLYCDIITPVVVASNYVKVLKLIPILTNQEEKTLEKSSYIFYESQHLDFIPLAHTTLSTCHFSLRHISGAPFMFNNKRQEVNINLVFMKDV
jgi:hypothetical protein